MNTKTAGRKGGKNRWAKVSKKERSRLMKQVRAKGLKNKK